MCAMRSTSISRRRFLQGLAAAAAAGPILLSRSAFAQTTGAARKVRHASIGASGQAWSDIRSFASHPAFELVAVADVDKARVEKVKEMFPNVRIYQDWRELLKKEKKNLDSISVSTPDHMHAAIAMAAMREKKPVYVQKPLAGTIAETRALTEYARKHNIISQMGIQISSTVPQRLGEALVRSGAIGKIKEVHTFSSKSWGEDGLIAEGQDAVPDSLNWDEWLGVHPERPYKDKVYHPGEWRKRVGFGTGTLGDMGCHIFSPPYRALGLTAPVKITSHGPAPSRDNWAVRAKYHYVYPGTPITADKTVDVYWYDGGEKPPEAILALVGDKLTAGPRPVDQGTIFVGTEGTLLLPHMGKEPFLFPAEKFADLKLPEIAPRDHYHEFLDAVLAGGSVKCSTNFDYAGPLTESVLMGNVAAWFPGETLEYDSKKVKFTNKPEANTHLTRVFRKGWKVKGVKT
jgi:predicted dehydrogenase